MRYAILLFLTTLLGTGNLSAQFDTIAGPFSSVNAMVESEDKLYVALFHGAGVEVWSIDPSTSEPTEMTIFTNPFFQPIGNLFVAGEDLYLTSSGETISDGRIYRVADINSEMPSTELYLSLPWLPTNVAIMDSVMYISRFFFVGGSIYRYDMRNPEAEVEFYATTDNNSLTDLTIAEGQLYLADITDNRIRRVDLDRPTPFVRNILSGVDSPLGLTVDDDRLYVAVGNLNSNATSRVKVYDLSSGGAPALVAEVADNTNLAILDVARVSNQTYVLENVDGEGDEGYLLRIQNTTNTREASLPVQVAVYPNPTSERVSFPNQIVTQVDAIDSSGCQLGALPSQGNEFDLSALPVGMYTLRVHLADGQLGLARVIKQ